MKRIILSTTLAIALIFSSINSHAWGFFAHKRINRMAVFTLPPEMFTFYKTHIEYVTEHSVDPDRRRSAVPGEHPKHFIDADHYLKYIGIDVTTNPDYYFGPKPEDPFSLIPRKWSDAKAKYGQEELTEYGLVPWNITWVQYQLEDAFRQEDLYKILKYSSDLGHYIGDCHVPMHTTENYNGGFTNQRGIHGFWESRLPELFATDNYTHLVGRAEYVESPIDMAWDAAEASYAAMDSVIKFEKILTDSFPSDAKFAYEQRGSSTVRTYSRDFSTAYHNMLDGQVERRMNAAIFAVGSMWYTAWVNAGQPDLNKLSDKEISAAEKEEEKRNAELWKQGKIKNSKRTDD
jgi:hypothetical protein